MRDTPTIRPIHNFNPFADAEELKQAIRFGFDESKVTDILCRRSAFQRQQIDDAYKCIDRTSVSQDIEAFFDDSYADPQAKKFYQTLMLDPIHFEALEIKKSLKGPKRNNNVVLELLSPRTNKEIIDLKRAYRNIFNKGLEDDFRGVHTSRDYEKLIENLLESEREPNTVWHVKKAKEYARQLYEAGEGRWGIDEDTFIHIFSTLNPLQLRLVNRAYEKEYGHSIKEAIRNEFTGDLKSGLLALADIADDKAAYYAELIDKDLKDGSIGSNLARLILGRSEIDLGNIREHFRKNGKPLDELIDKKYFGGYKNALLKIVRGN